MNSIEARRYALLQAACTLFAGERLGGTSEGYTNERNYGLLVDRAEEILKLIENREK